MSYDAPKGAAERGLCPIGKGRLEYDRGRNPDDRLKQDADYKVCVHSIMPTVRWLVVESCVFSAYYIELFC